MDMNDSRLAFEVRSLDIFVFRAPADPPVRRTNLKDAVPCVALGTTLEGETSVAVFVQGIDLDVVPFAVDAASRCGVQRAVVVARAKDVTPSMQKMAERASILVSFQYLNI